MTIADDKQTIANAAYYETHYDEIQDKINSLNTQIAELTEQIEALKSGAYDYYDLYGKLMSSTRFKDVRISVDEKTDIDVAELKRQYDDWAKRFPTKTKSAFSYIKTNANNAKIKQKA